MEIIRCKKCGIEKELNPENFCFSTKGICKTKSTCRQCIILQHREYNTKNRELINAKNRVYNARPDVKAHKSEYKKKYRAEHLEEIKIKDAEYRQREDYKEQKRQYYLDNREYFIAKTKKNYQKNRKKYIDKFREKRQTDEVFRFKNNVRKAIRFALKFNDAEKCKKTEEITKLRIDKLKKYLLDTFEENYGYKWDGKENVEVDHIIPLQQANTKQQVLDLCYYTNLQLLKSKDNASKGFTGSWGQ